MVTKSAINPKLLCPKCSGVPEIHASDHEVFLRCHTCNLPGYLVLGYHVNPRWLMADSEEGPATEVTHYLRNRAQNHGVPRKCSHCYVPWSYPFVPGTTHCDTCQNKLEDQPFSGGWRVRCYGCAEDDWGTCRLGLECPLIAPDEKPPVCTTCHHYVVVPTEGTTECTRCVREQGWWEAKQEEDTNDD